MTRLKRAFRFAALALATVQLSVSEGASIYEAFAVRDSGPAPSVASPDVERGAPAHVPGTCPACQTLNAFARLPDASCLLFMAGHTGAFNSLTDGGVFRQAARSELRSRAPPLLLG